MFLLMETFNITAAGAVDREFVYIFWPKTGQNWSKWIDPGYSSYPTKYGLTIFYGDPFHAPGNFRDFPIFASVFNVLEQN